MRKYFLLIIYMTSLAFTQQGLNAKTSVPAFKIQRNSITLTKAHTNYSSSYDCYEESNFFLSDLNLEDDENGKSKPVYSAGLSWLQADVHFISETDHFKYRSSFHPELSFDLFKLNRAFRL